MDYPPDQYFFRYTDREAAFEHILPTGRLRPSPYTRVNDPAENKPWLFPAAYFVDEASDDPRAPRKSPTSSSYPKRRASGTRRSSSR